MSIQVYPSRALARAVVRATNEDIKAFYIKEVNPGVQEYHITGSTGNTYLVHLWQENGQQLGSCTCAAHVGTPEEPDQPPMMCKHIAKAYAQELARSEAAKVAQVAIASA